MDDFEDEDEDDANKSDTVTLWSISFEKIKSKMTSVFGNGKVMKLVKQKGIREVAPSNAQITIRYMGHFEYRDEPFDSSVSRGGSVTFRLNQGALIPGLEMGTSTMRQHEIAFFIVHPDLGYGRYGCDPRILPNEEILFVVHLIDYMVHGSIEILENLSIGRQKDICERR